MAKAFADYAREREATMTGADREVVRAFDQAAAFGSVILGGRKARGLRQSDLAELSGSKAPARFWWAILGLNQ
ncbi:hypothetical protein [Intrasporangium sp.]|uniref:hypothetical protein n=1 Tax=Intrasporangium sp. TaxID=1925024 RepID=UPI003221810A